MVDLNYIAAPWSQKDRGDGLCWYPPPNTVGSFDMRGAEQPLGFFCVSKLPLGSDYTLLGKGDIRGSIEVSTSIRAFWREFLGLTIEEMPDSITNLRDILIKTFEELGDPTGEKRFFPPTVTSKGNLELFLGGHNGGGEKHLIRRRKFTGKDDDAFFNIQPHYQNIYQGYIDEEMNAETREDAEKIVLARKKVLWNWERELGVSTKDLQPFGVNEKAVKPTTTITDNFNRGNADPISNSAEGWSWTEVSGADWTITDNKALVTNVDTTPVSLRAESALSSANHYAQWDKYNASNANSSGGGVRFASAAETMYRFRTRNLEERLYKQVTGVLNILATSAETWSNGDTIYLEVDGSTITVKRNGVEWSQSPVSNSDIAGGLRTGLCSRAEGSWDNFQAADLAAGGHPMMKRYGGVPFVGLNNSPGIGVW